MRRAGKDFIHKQMTQNHIENIIYKLIAYTSKGDSRKNFAQNAPE